MIKELIKNFAEGNVEMYGSKEEIGEAEDYFPFILIPILTDSTPSGAITV